MPERRHGTRSSLQHWLQHHMEVAAWPCQKRLPYVPTTAAFSASRTTADDAACVCGKVSFRWSIGCTLVLPGAAAAAVAAASSAVKVTLAVERGLDELLLAQVAPNLPTGCKINGLPTGWKIDGRSPLSKNCGERRCVQALRLRPAAIELSNLIVDIVGRRVQSIDLPVESTVLAHAVTPVADGCNSSPSCEALQVRREACW
mmetsp:Transcript_21225/g.46823  ORF Transcript_21225/g.46823 Transcript_21225/m.46823 type:complete len:202 (+) Transcript_21225:147-752(+)